MDVLVYNINYYDIVMKTSPSNINFMYSYIYI